MIGWLNAELLKPNTIIHQVFYNFVVQFTSDLQEWWITLGQYQKLQLL